MASSANEAVSSRRIPAAIAAGSGVSKKTPGLAFEDRVEKPAEAKRRGGLAERGRLDRRQAEVLVGRRDQPGGVGVEPSELRVVDRARRS